MIAFVQVTPTDFGRPILVNVNRIEAIQPPVDDRGKASLVYSDGSVVPISETFDGMVEKLHGIGCAIANY